MAILKYRDPVTGQFKQDIHIVSDVSSVNGQTGVITLTAQDVGAASIAQLNNVRQSLETHAADSVVHITAAERAKWNEDSTAVFDYDTDSFTDIAAAKAAGKAVYCRRASEVEGEDDGYYYFSLIYFDGTEKVARFANTDGASVECITVKVVDDEDVWSDYVVNFTDDVDSAEDTDLATAKAVKDAVAGVSTDITEHINDNVRHITAAERAKWNEDSVYVATYGTTPYATIKTEEAKGKVIYAKAKFSDIVKKRTPSMVITDDIDLYFPLLTKTDDAAAGSNIYCFEAKVNLADIDDNIIESCKIYVTDATSNAWGIADIYYLANSLEAIEAEDSIFTNDDIVCLGLLSEVVENINETITSHTTDSTIHITSDERTAWNAKVDQVNVKTTLDTTSADYIPNTSAVKNAVDAVAGDLSDHIEDDVIHITAAERTKWNEDSVYVATYNVTTFATIKAEKAKGKHIVCAVAGEGTDTGTYYYDLKYYSEDSKIIAFANSVPTSIDWVILNDNTWSKQGAEFVASLEGANDTDLATVEAVSGAIDAHASDTTLHITAAERTAWNAKVDKANVKSTLDTTSADYVPNTTAVKNAIEAEGPAHYSESLLTKALFAELEDGTYKLDNTLYIKGNEYKDYTDANGWAANLNNTLIANEDTYITVITKGSAKELYADGFRAVLADNEIKVYKDGIAGYKLSALEDDSTHRVVTDTQIATWNAKQDALSNADLLETYTQTDADISQAVADDHTHDNKDLLDLITETPATDAALQAEITARTSGDTNLQSQIDAIEARSDVADVVGTKSELLAYDTSKLSEDDIIKVLADESQGGARTYYRWHRETWALIGSEGISYTKTETDELLDEKADLDDFNSHVNNTTAHITAAERTKWNNGTTAVGASTPQNYQVLWVDTTDTETEYTDPTVRWDIEQNITDTGKSQARRNLGLENAKECVLFGKATAATGSELVVGPYQDENMYSKRVIMLVDIKAHAEDKVINVIHNDGISSTTILSFTDKASETNHIYRVDGFYAAEEDRWDFCVSDKSGAAVTFMYGGLNKINETILEFEAEPEASDKEFLYLGISATNLPVGSRITTYAVKGSSIPE